MIRKHRIGELFCGAGGFALGAMQTGRVEHAWLIDRDQDACLTAEHNLKTQVDCMDVKDMVLSELTAIDGLMFGFPCNNFSMVGDRTGLDGEYGQLYKYGRDGLRYFQPKFFIAENVGGIRSNGLDVILRDLMDTGYDVWHRLYKFEELGVPQRRHRVIITGFRKDLKINYCHLTDVFKMMTTREALDGITEDLSNNEIPRTSDGVAELLSHIKPGENMWMADLPEHLMEKYDIRNKRVKTSQHYRRMPLDEPAYTLTANGGGGMQGYHPTENRALTNRERARLQTFPDDYHFIGSYGSVRKQIGMAVSPLAAKRIVDHTLDFLP